MIPGELSHGSLCNYEGFLSLVCCFLVLTCLFDSPSKALADIFERKYKAAKERFSAELDDISKGKRRKFASSDLVGGIYSQWKDSYKNTTNRVKYAYNVTVFMVCLYSLSVIFCHGSHWLDVWNVLVVLPPVLAWGLLCVVYGWHRVQLSREIRLHRDEIKRENIRTAYRSENQDSDTSLLESMLQPFAKDKTSKGEDAEK